jgi:hypothetical protein
VLLRLREKSGVHFRAWPRLMPQATGPKSHVDLLKTMQRQPRRRRSTKHGSVDEGRRKT